MGAFRYSSQSFFSSHPPTIPTFLRVSFPCFAALSISSDPRFSSWRIRYHVCRRGQPSPPLTTGLPIIIRSLIPNNLGRLPLPRFRPRSNLGFLDYRHSSSLVKWPPLICRALYHFRYPRPPRTRRHNTQPIGLGLSRRGPKHGQTPSIPPPRLGAQTEYHTVQCHRHPLSHSGHHRQCV